MMSDASSAFRIKHGGAISRAVALIRPRGERQRAYFSISIGVVPSIPHG
jgi:hypothetical protein